MELNYWEKQLILYIKGHFKRTNYEKDLKYFPANYYEVNIESVNQKMILNMVVELFEKLYENDYIHFRLSTFLSNVFKRVWFEREAEEIKWDDVLNQMLSQIHNLEVLGTGLNLGKPDRTLLKLILEEIMLDELVLDNMKSECK